MFKKFFEFLNNATKTEFDFMQDELRREEEQSKRNEIEEQFIEFHNCLENDFFIRVQEIDLQKYDLDNDGFLCLSVLEQMIYLEHCALQPQNNEKCQYYANKLEGKLMEYCNMEIQELISQDILEMKLLKYFNNIETANILKRNNASITTDNSG